VHELPDHGLEATGGQYVHSTAVHDGVDELVGLVEGLTPQRAADGETRLRPIERYHWPLTLAIALLLARLAIGERRRLATALALLLPMTLLNIIFVDSIRGLNPVVNIKLVGITLLPYCYMAIPLYLGHKALFWACLKLPNPVGPITLTLCEVYGAMVSAHVLGRFAWKQKDKLIWD